MLGFNPFGGMGQPFEAFYRAMPVAFIDKQSAEFGDKVILPPSALDRLASLSIEYPMTFNVESSTSGRSTHCGVLEFVAEEGVVYMPHWMMQNLLLSVGDRVKLRNVRLPKGTYVKLQPVTSDFLDISNPKAVLERTLRSYTCLTVGDCFVVNYNNKNYEIEVKEAKPKRAISVVETDCQVDFEAPKDYVEPDYKALAVAKAAATAAAASSGPTPMQEDTPSTSNGTASAPASGSALTAEEEDTGPKFNAFAGTARRLDGKPAAPTPPIAASSSGSSSAQPGASTSASGSKVNSRSTSPAAGGSSKAGTFIGFAPTGNRLLDKLNKDKAAAGGPGIPKPPAPAEAATAAEEEKKDGSSFQAFKGKGFSLRG